MNEFENQSETDAPTEEEAAELEEVEGTKYDGGEIPRTEAVPEE